MGYLHFQLGFERTIKRTLEDVFISPSLTGCEANMATSYISEQKGVAPIYLPSIPHIKFPIYFIIQAGSLAQRLRPLGHGSIMTLGKLNKPICKLRLSGFPLPYSKSDRT